MWQDRKMCMDVKECERSNLSRTAKQACAACTFHRFALRTSKIEVNCIAAVLPVLLKLCNPKPCILLQVVDVKIYLLELLSINT